jgi:hypothetical protein
VEGESTVWHPDHPTATVPGLLAIDETPDTILLTVASGTYSVKREPIR